MHFTTEICQYIFGLYLNGCTEEEIIVGCRIIFGDDCNIDSKDIEEIIDFMLNIN